MYVSIKIIAEDTHVLINFHFYSSIYSHEARLYIFGRAKRLSLSEGIDQIRKEYQTQWQHRKGARFISWKFSFCHESSLHCQTKHHVPPSIQPTSSYFSSSSSSSPSSSSFFSFTLVLFFAFFRSFPMTGVITFLCCSDTRPYVTAARSICLEARRVRNGKCYLLGITSRKWRERNI